MLKEVNYKELCHIFKKLEISSPLCQNCENYINHKLIKDEHGRIHSLLIECKSFNFV
jgi:hypothetical protein